MENITYSIRNMKINDIPALIELYKAEQWRDGCYNMLTWSQFYPDGFKVAENDEGEIVGTCYGIRHGEDIATVGGYIVKEAYRGKGIGRKLWEASLQHIEDRKALTNGEKEAWKMYFESGDFPIVEKEWRFLMHHTDDEVNTENLSSILPEGVTIHKYSDTDLDAICSYDSSLLGFDRKLVLCQLFQAQMTRAFVAYKKQKCIGYGCIQPNIYGGSYIVPLFADDPMVAENLFKKLIDSFPLKNSFEIATISKNTFCNDLLKKLNCRFDTVECVRLYRKGKISTNINSAYGLFIDFSPF